jgi:hypothetical protein
MRPLSRSSPLSRDRALQDGSHDDTAQLIGIGVTLTALTLAAYLIRARSSATPQCLCTAGRFAHQTRRSETATDKSGIS